MKFLVVFLTLMTASVWAVAIPAPEPEPASSRNVGVLAPVKVVSGHTQQPLDCAAVDLELQVSGSCISFALYLVLQA
ncbi:predicted protein [Histoplasma mississippiense (nom. inval.)]|uniref:predicted protein n=1 Tax=Ajellomyces capsulatus (strain NAm1 / WU24) TaxID=2059318 RepID=UPI000157C1D5|nr:predicted protein [Histoplasma mississippiense (nom. inval.)]EDN07582.1 predicted protein [Histoplasma mississippiense (nom. inval.)]